MFLGGADILITLAPFLTPLLPPAAVFFLTEHQDPPAMISTDTLAVLEEREKKG